MVNIEKLKSTIYEKKSTPKDLALSIGIDRATLYRKLNRSESFNIGEVNKIKEALGLTKDEALDIFFGD
ncbi:phage repressor protein [Mammaliicoccus sciuri]|uniref:helix-turn-helix domain-containing protein n=1 Tax=Mammaliicoccus sciuri TaxID=1296 RepID=UPI000A01380D|nr:helix-turn-helix domain-containing protein [Mammaliicoccus sciuri]ORI05561.1 phage repressor protein [Mammaliicoccus sciuri]PCM42025.1 phage repressor protein [Mammaliicoccus sciuri]